MHIKNVVLNLNFVDRRGTDYTVLSAKKNPSIRTSANSNYKARCCIGIYSVSADTQVQESERKMVSNISNSIPIYWSFKIATNTTTITRGLNKQHSWYINGGKPHQITFGPIEVHHAATKIITLGWA